MTYGPGDQETLTHVELCAPNLNSVASVPCCRCHPCDDVPWAGGLVTHDSLGFLHWMMAGRRHSTQDHPLSMNMAYAFKTHPLDTVHAKIITGIHYEERAQCKVHDKRCFQHHPRSRARALRARLPCPPRQMTIMMSMNIWDTHDGHDALSA